jgi:sulfide:quinone oxidoreductase
MPEHIIIVGGGVGGTITANLLARRLDPDKAQVTLIEDTGQHVYMPGWLYLPLNNENPQGRHIVRNESELLHRHVRHICATVTNINTHRRELLVHSSPGQQEIGGTGGAVEASYVYDYLVLATGARLAPEDLSGLTSNDGARGWHHFYSGQGALELRQALQSFTGGRIVIAVGGIPYRCPPAPLEFAFLLEEWITRQGLRSRTEIEYLFPLPRVFPIESVAEAVTPLLEERHIHSTLFFNAERVDTAAKVISSLEGEDMPYDLLVLVPPHRGARVIEEAGLGDEQGWIPTERHTLQVKGQQHIYALGDATDLPISKSGSAAHFEARVVAARILAALRGEEPGESGVYDGEVMCFLETGQRKATQLVFNYEHPPRPPRPGRYYHMEKQIFNRAYWHLVPQGLV